jgi:hypothetical protein
MSPSPNNYSGTLRSQAHQLARAVRHSTPPGACGLQLAPPPTPAQQRASLLLAPINCSAAGDNLLIPTLAGRKMIYELCVWNVTQQTLRLTAGAAGVLLLQLTNFPALTGYTLGFNGHFSQPHFEIPAGLPFVLNLGGAFQVDGFIRYRIADNSSF